MTPEQKAIAISILGEPVGSKVTGISVRPPTQEEKARWAGGLTVGDVITFEMDQEDILNHGIFVVE